MNLPPDLLLRTLAWATLVLLAVVFLLILVGTLIQVRRDRQNRHRIARFQDWEKNLNEYLFGEEGQRSFPPILREDQDLFLRFLSRYQATLAGQEAEALKELYLRLDTRLSLPERLRSRHPKTRARAIQEIGMFGLLDQLDRVVPLLGDPAPFVAHLAAQVLARSGDLRFARLVLEWVLREESYQRERLLQVLEGFGPDLLPWMEANLRPPDDAPDSWVLFALLAAAHRHRGSEGRLLDLLDYPIVDLQAAALKALATLTDPLTYPRVLPLTRNEAWPVRAQAAKTVGLVAGLDAIPILIALTSDPVYEVRRNAAQGLADLGHAGTSALTWIADDPTADRFARDIARERLEWTDERGHL
jgi:hypothetical protein